MNNSQVREPLFLIVKGDNMSLKKKALVYGIAIVVAMILTALICFILFGANPIRVIVEIFKGNFQTEMKFWLLLQDMSLLLLVALALLPAFKMKFWNLGGNGQILIGCLACVACMFYGKKNKTPEEVTIILMIVTSILAGAIWAVIPAIFKAKWNTNESLFTLMMNYIASGLVVYMISQWVQSGSGTLTPIKYANLPRIYNPYLLTIICAVVITVFMFFYLKKSKHGYELSVVGESYNTAKYVGINVKKTIIRTVALSGAICGLVGLILGGSINHNINSNSANNMGFTAIMVVWFAKCDPLLMVLSSFGITFLTKGMYQVKTAFGLNNNAVADLIVGFVYFIIIACEFFIIYKINLKKKKKNLLNDINDTSKKEGK